MPSIRQFAESLLSRVLSVTDDEYSMLSETRQHAEDEDNSSRRRESESDTASCSIVDSSTPLTASFHKKPTVESTRLADHSTDAAGKSGTPSEDLVRETSSLVSGGTVKTTYTIVGHDNKRGKSLKPLAPVLSALDVTQAGLATTVTTNWLDVRDIKRLAPASPSLRICEAKIVRYRRVFAQQEQPMKGDFKALQGILTEIMEHAIRDVINSQPVTFDLSQVRVRQELEGQEVLTCDWGKFKTDSGHPGQVRLEKNFLEWLREVRLIE